MIETPDYVFLFVFLAVPSIWIAVTCFGWYADTHMPDSINRLHFLLRPRPKRKVYEQYHHTLHGSLLYFRLLNDVEQTEFIRRLNHIRKQKVFVGRGMEVTDEMEILVCGALTQLTFGLQNFDLDQLTHIHLTPESFYSGLLQRDVKGLTFDNGKMIISWADFKHGYSIDTDGVNLGLHELAHSLMLDRLANMEFANELAEWNRAALQELNTSRVKGVEGVFREYAFTNVDEFWACSIECFFEVPISFKQKAPQLYEKLSATLNQDMAARLQVYESLRVKSVKTT